MDILENMRKMLEAGKISKEDIERAFPELKESEDERIRKWIVNYIHHGAFNEEEHPMALKAIEWLEKQKEQKDYRKLYEDIVKSEWFKKSYENKSLGDGDELEPAEWREDWREEDIQTRFAFYTYKDDPSTLYLSNVFVEESSRNHGFGTRILRAAEKVAETVGATTISLKVKQDSLANAWYRKNGYGYVAFEDGYDWLEKNLEYMKPTKSVEWSEEDEKIANEILDHFNTGNAEWFNWFNARFKSLRPQPHWKPSEEQMGALKYELGEGGRFDKAALASLYNQLKKLM